MTPDVLTLFEALADLPAEARARYLTDHSVDPITRREVEELLTYDCSNLDPFPEMVSTAAKALFSGDATGLRCGAFRLVSVLGTGGMGVVYLAQRADGEVTQRAAVKLMQPGWSQVQRERFLREREILAGLTHPNIAHLVDAGHLNDGQPYLAMEYVEGKQIDEYCSGLGTRQKIQLFLKVCAAVDYLHANLVLHRDLKPSNILVTAAGEPKLLDFGIAKMRDLAAETTRTQVRVLTPDYASPEQITGGTVGNSTDIYSLGALLYSLLTGKPARDLHPGDFSAELKGDLGLIIRTATRPEPQDRYASVAAFADDLAAFLESRPVRARRQDWFYRTGKFVRRQRGIAFMGAAMLVAVAVVSGLWRQQIRSSPGIADVTPRRLTANTPDLPIEAAAISPDGKVVAYTDSLGIHLHYPATGETRLLAGTTGHVLSQWTRDGSALRTQALDESGKVTGALVSVDGSVRRVGDMAGESQMSPDGRLRASIPSNRQRIFVEDGNGGRKREVWTAGHRSLDSFQWSPSGQQMAILSTEPAGSTLEIVDLVSLQRTPVISPGKKLLVGSFVWPKDNRIIMAVHDRGRGVNSQGSSNLWEIRLAATDFPRDFTLRRLTAWTDFPIRFGSLTTDGKRLVFIRSFRQRDVHVAGLDRSHTRMGTPRRLTLDLGDDYPTSWTRDSKTVVFTSDRNGPTTIFLQDIGKQTANQLVFGVKSQIIARLTPDGKSILFCSREDGKRGVMRTPVTGGKAELLFKTSTAIGLRCSKVGPCTITERENGVVVVSELDPVKGTKVREIYRDTAIKFAGPDLSPDAKWLATPSGSKIVIRSFATGAIVREIPVQGATDAMKLVNLDYAPDGKGFFAGQTTPTETVQLYVDLSGKASVLWRQAGKSSVWGIPSPDGRYLAMMVYTDDSNVYMLDDL